MIWLGWFLLFSNFSFAENLSFFEKQTLILNHLGARQGKVSPEIGVNPNEFKKPLSSSEIEALLKIFDPTGEFLHYSRWDVEKLQVFQDRDAYEVLDFEVPFTKKVPDAEMTELSWQALPFSDLRVAIDPGHFGNEIDLDLGKAVTKNKVTLKEGEITYETALLLKENLVAAGLQPQNILISHEKNTPATQARWDDFPVHDYSRLSLLFATDEPWFLSLMQKLQSSADLEKVLASSPELTDLFPFPDRDRFQWLVLRNTFFAKWADLFARAKIINDFSPHITVVIHYDAKGYRDERNHKIPLQSKMNHVKVFVPGQVEPNEMGSTFERQLLVHHLSDPEKFFNSIELGRHIVQNINQTTKVPIARLKPQKNRGPALAPGVFPRNLALNRLVLNTQAMVYLEALFYNHSKEFFYLTRKNKQRVGQVAEGITTGILNFLKAKK